MPRSAATARAFTGVTRATGSRDRTPTSTALTMQRIVPGRELAVVAHADAFDARFAHLTDQAAKLSRQRRRYGCSRWNSSGGRTES